MAKAMEPFSDSQVVLGSPGPGPMYRLNPPSPPPLIGQPYSYLHESLLINARLCAQRDITGEAFVHCDIYNRRLHRWCNGQRARLECGRSWGSCSDRVYQTHEYISCHFPTWILKLYVLHELFLFKSGDNIPLFHTKFNKHNKHVFCHIIISKC